MPKRLAGAILCRFRQGGLAEWPNAFVLKTKELERVPCVQIVHPPLRIWYNRTMTLKEQILELRSKGLSYKKIVNELGCSKSTVTYHCGVGQVEKSNARQRNRNSKIRRYIQEYKQGKQCADCGEDYPYWILEFDHLENKSFTIGNTSEHRANIDALKKEIEKCEVVCANCHRNRTFNRKKTHGGGTLDVESQYS